MAHAGGGFLQVHVSGLPADCEDAEVETQLRQVIAGTRRPCQRSPATQPEAAAEEAAPAEPPEEASAKDDTSSSAVAAASAEAAAAATAAAGSAQMAESKTCGEDAQGEEEAADAEQKEEADASAAPDAEVEAPAGNEDEVEAELREAAAFVSCVVVRHKDTAECKGYCFLTFLTGEEAEAAIVLLNAEGGVEILGQPVQAQLSVPKDRKKQTKEEELNDLRCRRQRYQAVGKKAQHGHFCNGAGPGRNEAGRVTGITGTRGGNQLKEISRIEAQSGKSNTSFESAGYKAGGNLQQHAVPSHRHRVGK
eukprot:TRINITY_DN23759_c0_g1_i1.p1 TRINITY_DN23759_c0_g1~~TRINITY_DN23759_c0_g1_i1.p1  ORF type:complete len:308 (+),score=112.97 TRINITY_DN23759_c0_g1_i1:51-974(+)